MFKHSHAWTRLAVLGLALTLVAPASAALPDALLPGNADAVVTINVKGLLDSAVVKKHAIDEIKKLIKDRAEVNQILTALNFDPLKDLSSLTISVALGADPRQPDALIIARGNFDVAKIETALKAAGDKLAVSEHSKVKVYEGKGGQQPVFGAFLDKSTMVGSTKKAAVTEAIDRSQGKGGKVTYKKELTAAIDKVNASQTIWLALGVTGQIKEAIKRAPQGAELADKLEALTAGITVKDNVLTEVIVHTTDKDTATAIKDALDQFKQLLAFGAGQNPDFGPILTDIVNDMKLTTDGSRVKLISNINADTIDKLVKKVKERPQP